MQTPKIPNLRSRFAFALALIPCTSFAAQDGDIVVTASRTAETVNDSLAAVTVFTQEDIQKSSARSLQDLLNGTPGLVVSNAGGQGKNSSLFMRGTNSNHVLVLIDGVRAGSATLGTTAFQHIPLSQIDRIEIVRGPRSSLYGAEAVGGVIQIFTRREPSTLRSEIQVGSDSTSRLTQSFGLKQDDTQLSLTASLMDTKGFNSQKDSQPDRDGYDNQSVSAALDHRWNQQWRAGASFFRAQGSNDYDNKFDAPDVELSDEFVQQVTSANLGFTPNERTDLRLQLAENRDESLNFRNGDDDGQFLTKRYLVSLQGDFQMTEQQLLTLGIDNTDDRVDGTTDYTQTSRYNRAAFAQWQAQQDKLDWQLSGRVDRNEAFGRQTTWNAAAGYWFSSSIKSYLSYGTAFKAPTFNDLYYPDVGFFRGNPDLKEENSASWEAGLKGQYQHQHWTLSFFRTDIDNLINYDSVLATNVNVSKAKIRGAEMTWGGRWEGFGADLNATYVDAEDRDTQKDLQRRPDWSGRASLSYAWQAYMASASVRAQSSAYDDARNTIELGGFAVTDLGFTWLPAEHWSLKTEVLNVFDKDYETLKGYNTEARSYWLTLAYQQ